MLYEEITVYNFVMQVTGTRRVLIIDPELSFQGLYSYPLHHPYDTYSMVDWENLDTEQWPLSSQVRGKVCILKPGDVLFIPSCWWALLCHNIFVMSCQKLKMANIWWLGRYTREWCPNEIWSWLHHILQSHTSCILLCTQDDCAKKGRPSHRVNSLCRESP